MASAKKQQPAQVRELMRKTKAQMQATRIESPLAKYAIACE